MTVRTDDDETRDFFIDVGRTLLMCGLVEKHIKHLSRSLKFSEWLDFNEADISFHNAIEKMKKNYGLDDDFIGSLHNFRENRNKFVHEIWDLGDSRLNTEEGRREALSFIVALYAVASALNKLLYPHVRERLRVADKHHPDFGGSLLSMT